MAAGEPGRVARIKNAVFRATYKARGFVVVGGALPPARCAAIVRDAVSRWPVAVASVMQPHRESDEVLAAARVLARWAKVALRVEDGGLSLIQTQFFFGAPGSPGYPPHQDNHAVRAPSNAFVSVWAALDDVRTEHGALEVWRWTHKSPLLPVGQPSRVIADPNTPMEVATSGRGTPVELSMGDAVMIHPHLVHSSRPNVSSRFRSSLLCTYVLPGAPFRPGGNAARAEFPV